MHTTLLAVVLAGVASAVAQSLTLDLPSITGLAPDITGIPTGTIGGPDECELTDDFLSCADAAQSAPCTGVASTVTLRSGKVKRQVLQNCNCLQASRQVDCYSTYCPTASVPFFLTQLPGCTVGAEAEPTATPTDTGASTSTSTNAANQPLPLSGNGFVAIALGLLGGLL